MSGPALGPVAAAGLRLPVAPSGPWRPWWAIDRQAAWVRFAQGATGRATLVAAFAVLAQAVGTSWPYVLAAAAFAYLPAWRHWIALIACGLAVARGAAGWLATFDGVRVLEGLPAPTARAVVGLALLAYLGVAAAALAWSRHHPQAWLARRPVLGGLGATALLAAVASAPWLHGAWRLATWVFLAAFTTYLWALAYAIADQRTRARGPLAWQLGLLHPMWRASAWSASPTPFGKGAAFLRQHQAASDEALAVTQLKALKLMAWAGVLLLAHRGLAQVVEVRLGVPSTQAVYAAFLAGHPVPRPVSWAALVWATLGGALGFAVWGHKIVAVARLAGFALPRNTWRPLQARTLAEFWNRYYFYFKELLVEFFFFPTFLRVLRPHPRLRLFFATFMAAGVGNAVYHFTRDIHQVAALGWQEAVSSFSSYLVYSAILATGIGLSQARTSAGRRLPEGWAGRLWCGWWVWFFFVCLQVFGDEGRGFTLGERIAFCLQLLGG